MAKFVIAAPNDPISNFANCPDFCELCRAEAERCIDLVERGITVGKPTEAFAPEFTLRARLENYLLEKRRRDESLASGRNRGATSGWPWHGSGSLKTIEQLDTHKQPQGPAENPGNIATTGSPSPKTSQPEVEAQERIWRPVATKANKSDNSDIPKGWITVSAVVSNYGIQRSSVHRWIQNDLNADQRGRRQKTNEIIVLQSAFEDILRRKGRLSP